MKVVWDESGHGMKLVLDESGFGMKMWFWMKVVWMKVVLDESGFGMKVVLDELVFYLHHHLGTSLPLAPLDRLLFTTIL